MNKRTLLILLGTTCLLATLPAPSRADEILVSAAASLTDALNAIGKAFTRANPKTTVRFNFASSGALQRQREQGAPVDVFASAATARWTPCRRPGGSSRPPTSTSRETGWSPISRPAGGVKRWEDLTGSGVRRIALSNPDSVPSGRYARGDVDAARPVVRRPAKAVLGENVRQTLAYVAGGNADAGVVFATDARQGKGPRARRTNGRAGQGSRAHRLPGRRRRRRAQRAARRFVRFLRGPLAQGILTRYGFTAANPPRGKAPR